MLRTAKNAVLSITPAPVLSTYHLLLAWFGAVLYGFPARHMLTIGVTGTKGKTSTTELVNAILEEAGQKTVLINSIRFKTPKTSKRNLTRMSMLGRFFIQRTLHHALKEGATAAILEMTSEGARQSRHRFIDMDALIFTNLAPEHIESHGSYQAYADTKFKIGQELTRSKKHPRAIVANRDDREGGRYLLLPVENVIPFSLQDAKPYQADERGGFFTLEGENIAIRLPGEFSLRNTLAAALLARSLGIPIEVIRRALSNVQKIPGRAEEIEVGQDFTVVVDYAHTPDSLKALYGAYANHRKICVLGSCGGGRDTWKRPIMGRIASEYCDVVILTNEDPYDEDPEQIARDMAHGMAKQPEIIIDRRGAIARAIALARPKDAVLITGKGTDPDIRGPRGSNVRWSDADIAREELENVPRNNAIIKI